MQIRFRLLLGVSLVFFIQKPELIKAQDPHRSFMDPIDLRLGQKSCPDGLIHKLDYFIVTGFVNITGYPVPRIPGYILLEYFGIRGSIADWIPLYYVPIDMRSDDCTGIGKVMPLKTCQCDYEGGVILRFKCNITAHTLYALKKISSLLVLTEPKRVRSRSEAHNMSKVYGTRGCELCDVGWSYSVNRGTSLYDFDYGMPVLALITALTLAVSSLCSGG